MDYLEIFHTVYSCSQSRHFIPTKCTKYDKYMYETYYVHLVEIKRSD